MCGVSVNVGSIRGMNMRTTRAAPRVRPGDGANEGKWIMVDIRPSQSVFRLYQRVVWGFCVVTVTLTAIVVTKILIGHGFLNSNEPLSSEIIPGNHRFNNFVLGVHILSAIPPLVIGPWSFVRRLLRTALHRWLGWIYVGMIFISSVTGFALAAVNTYGIFARLGFGMLAIVWFSTTYMALITARRRRYREHRDWMIRSYMITLAVVTVRVLPAPEHLTRAEWYPLMTWLCWVPNIILAEIYVRATTFRGRLKARFARGA
ncbi:DUF2306 domain-containing protein [Bradymonadaceae bacterium TMQ3]|nr:DUF2306 domain-containing protein [Bradymonadaceae bacterium TMQ3]